MAKTKKIGSTTRNREKRLVVEAEMYLAGMNLIEIAKKFSLSKSTVCQDLKVIRKRWREREIDCFGERQDRELGVCDRIEGEAWEGWERSQKPKVSHRSWNTDGRQQDIKETEEQVGDPRFLSIINDCIDKRCRMLSLFAPDRMVIANGPSFLAMPNLITEIEKRLVSLRPNIIETNGHTNGQHNAGIVPQDNGGMDAGPASNGNGDGPHAGPDAQ